MAVEEPTSAQSIDLPYAATADPPRSNYQFTQGWALLDSVLKTMPAVVELEKGLGRTVRVPQAAE